MIVMVFVVKTIWISYSCDDFIVLFQQSWKYSLLYEQPVCHKSLNYY